MAKDGVLIQIENAELPLLEQAINSRLRNRTGLMRQVGQYMVSSTQRKIQSNIPPVNAPLTKAWKKSGLTLRDSGGLQSSVSYKADSTEVAIGTNLEYGRIQQFGGVIKPKPKKAKWLTIPAGWETRRLMRRFGLTPRACMDGMRAAGYKIFKPQGKNVIMAYKKGQKPFVLFILKKSITIPAREYLKVDGTDQHVIENMAVDWIAGGADSAHRGHHH